MKQKFILRRLAALRLNHLPTVILAWIENDLDGIDPASVEVILNEDYVVLAIGRAVDEMVSRRPGVAQNWVAADGSGQVLETVAIPRRAVQESQRRAVKDLRPRPRRHLAEQMEFAFAASLQRSAARATEGDKTGNIFTSEGSASGCTR